MINTFIHDVERNFTCETVKADVVVVGAGIAGICAALAAARQGMDTVLVTDRPIPGGSASSEIRVGPGGADAPPFNCFARETGIVEEIFNNIYYKAQNAGKWRWFYFDQVYFDMLMSEPRLKLYFNTTIYHAEIAGNKIARVDGIQLRAEKIYRFDAPVFIDCTGDGTVGFLAGADFRMGRESKSEFNETHAPEKPDCHTMGATLLFTTVDAGHPVKFKAPPWAVQLMDLPSFKRINHSIGRMPDGTFYGFWWVEYGGLLNSIHDDGEITAHLRKLVYGIWDYIKNSGDYPDVENQEINWIGYLPGKRESRRLMGPYIANSHDFMQQKKFEDTFGYAGWPIDIHPPEGYITPEPGCTHDYLPGPTDIPFRCIYSRNISNLLFAGRHPSCTHEALGTLRLIPTTGVMGQAAGIAASMCVEKNILPDDITKYHIPELQRRLARTDQSILGYKLYENNDFSRKAKGSASSECKLQLLTPEHFRYLDNAYGLILPVKNRIEKISLYMEADNETEVLADFYLSDGMPQNYRVAGKQGTYIVKVRKKGWYDIEPGLESCPGNKIFVIVRRNENVRLYMARERLTGVLGITSKSDVLDYHTHYTQINDGQYIALTPCFKVEPEQDLYCADNVNNGFIRPYGLPNLWMSGEMKPYEPEWIQLGFNGEKVISRIELIFNPDLNHKRLYRNVNAVNPEMVKDYKITAILDNGNEEKLLAEGFDNFKRFVVHNFRPVKVTGIKLYIYSTWGGKHAEVFDVRVY